MTSEEKQDVHSRVDQEGFDYCFRFYSNWEEIKDEKFHKLRENYVKSAQELAKYIGFNEK